MTSTYMQDKEDKQRQVDFVKELAANVVNGIVQDIVAGKVPAKWDGIELRWLMAERFNDAIMGSDKKGGKRHRSYRNTVIVNNL